MSNGFLQVESFHFSFPNLIFFQFSLISAGFVTIHAVSSQICSLNLSNSYSEILLLIFARIIQHNKNIIKHSFLDQSCFWMSRLPLVVFGAILACILLSYMLFDSVSYQGTVQPLPNAVPRSHSHSTSPDNNSGSNRTTKFPKLIHYMWKSPQVSPPSETVRWQRGCKAVNPDHEFRMYYDAELVVFVEKEYPQYLPLFLALKGDAATFELLFYTTLILFLVICLSV